MQCRLSFTLPLCLVVLLFPIQLGAFQSSPGGARVSLNSKMRNERVQAPGDIPRTDLRVDLSMVVIPTRVTTPDGTSVTNLEKDNFRLYEDGVEQAITNFGHDDAPLSVGLLFDLSGSMQNKMTQSLVAVSEFFKTAGGEDEFFLVEFGERAKLAVPFTDDAKTIYQKISRAKPFGRTSLLDAIQLALAQMKGARNSRKAIVIVSDGGDNRSRHTAREVQNILLESDVQLYAIGIFDDGDRRKLTPEESNGPTLLSTMAEDSGGRHYPVGSLNDLPAIATRIGRELRDQYVLGFASASTARDGKYHRLRVDVAPPQQVRISHRQGYYAPAQ